MRLVLPQTRLLTLGVSLQCDCSSKGHFLGTIDYLHDSSIVGQNALMENITITPVRPVLQCTSEIALFAILRPHLLTCSIPQIPSINVLKTTVACQGGDTCVYVQDIVHGSLVGLPVDKPFVTTSEAVRSRAFQPGRPTLPSRVWRIRNRVPSAGCKILKC